LLGQLRGTDAWLLVPTHETTVPSFANAEGDVEKAFHAIDDSLSITGDFEVQKVHVDLLEVGDIVRVPAGSTPPADGIVVSNEETRFDESSLTGESREVKKTKGDRVFVGTINKLRVVEVRVDAIGGETMCVFSPISKIVDECAREASTDVESVGLTRSWLWCVKEIPSVLQSNGLQMCSLVISSL
jgi:high-affinity K+ transport system ATPase subunit B